MNKYGQAFSKGLIKENPVLRLVLGTCPTLAVTTAAINGLGMGAAATFVLVCSNIVISLLRRVIPDKVRLPAYIVIIAGFTTIVQMLVKAYLPDIDKALGIYLPLIVVNCIILGRAEAFASKNSVGLSALDGLGMGAGFTGALIVMGGHPGILRQRHDFRLAGGGDHPPHHRVRAAGRRVLCFRDAHLAGRQAVGPAGGRQSGDRFDGGRLRRLPARFGLRPAGPAGRGEGGRSS